MNKQGEKYVKCKAPNCKKEIIFVKTTNGKEMPIDYNSTDAEDLELLSQNKILAYKAGVHVPHWGTCTDPNYFRRPR